MFKTPVRKYVEYGRWNTANIIHNNTIIIVIDNVVSYVRGTGFRPSNYCQMPSDRYFRGQVSYFRLAMPLGYFTAS